MSEQETFESFLESTKVAIDELGPVATAEGEYLKLKNNEKINLEFRMDKLAEAVEKEPYGGEGPKRKQIRFYTYELDDIGEQGKKIIWDCSKRDSNMVWRTMADEKTNKLVVKRLGEGRDTKYQIWPWHAR